MSDLTETELLLGGFMSVVAVISIFCSLTTLILISRIGKWSGYLLLVYSLTACQLIYDLSFLFFGGYHYRTIYTVIQFLVTVGGVGVALWSNILSTVVLHIVAYHTSIDIGKYYVYLFSLAMTPAFGWAIYCIFSDKVNRNDSIYNYFRFLSILINFLVYLFITGMLYVKRNTPSLGPLKVLSSRFKYYPICQVLIRTPAVIYQYSYGFGTSGFSSPSTSSQLVSLIFYAIFAPIGGIAYFVVFLCMQPQAKEELQLLLRTHFSCLLICCSETLSMVGMQRHAQFFVDGDEGEIIISHMSLEDATSDDHPDNDNHHIVKQRQQNKSSQPLKYSLLPPTNLTSSGSGSGSHIHLSSSSPTPSPGRLSDVCYSPLSDSSFAHYQDMDEEELTRNMESGVAWTTITTTPHDDDNKEKLIHYVPPHSSHR